MANGTFTFSQSGRQLRITHNWPTTALVEQGSCNQRFAIGSLVAGRYQLEWKTIAPNSTFTFHAAFIVGDGGPPDAIPTLGSLSLTILLSLISIAALSQLNTPRT